MSDKIIKMPNSMIKSSNHHNILKLDGLTVMETCTSISEKYHGRIFLEDHLLLFVLSGQYAVSHGNQHITVNRYKQILAKDGITANALMPGAIATNLQRHIDKDTLKSWGTIDDSGNRLSQPKGWKTPEQGAATSVLLAISPSLEGIGGRYFEDCNEAEIVNNGNNYMNGAAPYALNSENADRLWNMYFPVVKKWFQV